MSMKKKELLGVVLGDKILGYLKSDLELDISNFWKWTHDLISFKSEDNYEYMKILIGYTPKEYFDHYMQRVFANIVRYKRKNVAKLFIDKFYDKYIDFIHEIFMYDDIELFMYTKKNVEIGQYYCKLIRLMSLKMFHIAKNNIAATSKEILKYAIQYGRTGIVKTLLRENVKIPKRVYLMHSNPECVKYLCKIVENLIVHDREIHHSILEDDECINLLNLWNYITTKNIMGIHHKNNFMIIKKFVTNETKHRFNGLNLIYYYIFYKKMDTVMYLRELYEVDHGVLIREIHHSQNNELFMFLFKDKGFIWKDEYEYIVNGLLLDHNLRILKFLGSKVNLDLNNNKTFKCILVRGSRKVLEYILNNHEVDYGRFLEANLKRDLHGILHRFIDRIWDHKISWDYDKYEDPRLCCALYTKRNIQIPDKFYKDEMYSKRCISLGGRTKERGDV